MENEVENLKGQIAALHAFVQGAIDESADLSKLLISFERVLVDAEGVWAEASDEFHEGMSGKAQLIRQHVSTIQGSRTLPRRTVRIPRNPSSESD